MMYLHQSDEIVYSGDQTSGYEGGSEYFDVNIPLFRKKYPNIRYLIFCDNVYSYKSFRECVCKAGYMLRSEKDTGEIFQPETVSSSFTVDCDRTFAYLFGIDLKRKEFVWLNAARDSCAHIAGVTELGFLSHYFKTADVLNVGTVFEMAASELVDRADAADVAVTDETLAPGICKEVIRSHDFEKIMALIEG